MKLRRPSACAVLLAMLALGMGCLLAGWIAFRRANQPWLQGVIYHSQVTLIPTVDRSRPKTSELVCPQVFLHGTKYNIEVNYECTAVHIGQIGYLPVTTDIRTTASVTYHDPVTNGTTPDVPPDVRRAALANVPWLRELPSTLLEHETSDQTVWIASGVATIVLLPLGLVLVVPPLVALPIMQLRRLRSRASRGSETPTAAIAP